MSDAVARLNTALEGRYTIERELGEGGMSTVYLADDVKHERKVALKVLKPELAALVGAERFLAEIKTTANLQHPHILALFDSGEADGFVFYVMPYVEGESLRDKLDRERQLGVKDSVAITQKVAGALDYAHERGVVHRDIKPGNILLSERGEPLIADFGIALAVAQAGAGRITETGLSLGTPHYMSPEQATGDRDVDPRSDVYALGCVLYEMLAGEPPFSASTAQAVLVRILTSDAPSITSVRRTVAPHVAAALAQALEKLPADRFASAAEFAAALADESFTYQARPRATVATPTVEVAAAPVPEPPARAWLRDPRSLVAAVAIALAAWGWLRPAPEPGVPTRAAVTGVDIPETAGGWRLAISPDGRSMLKVEEGAIHMRTASDPEWRQLPNTEGGGNPTFSPDGQSVAFSVGGGISKVSIIGGPALPVTTSGNNPHWGFDDTIVYQVGGVLYRVRSSGGDPQVLPESDSVSVRRPHLLPNRRAVVFGIGTGASASSSRILLFEIETGEVRELIPSGNQPRYVSTGHLIYGHVDGALMGVPFDVESLQVTGAPVTLLPSLAVFGGGASQFGVSNNGTLIYATAAGVDSGATGQVPLMWVDMEGNETPLPLRQAGARIPRLSPEGSRIAYQSDGQIWVYDIETGTNTQLTFEGTSRGPTWSPDGLFVYFISTRSGTEGPDLFRKAADGASEAEQLWRRGGGEVTLTSIAADGSWLVVVEVNTGTDRDMALASLGADSVSFREYLRADWGEYEGTISPNGRWMAHTSAELGGQQVFVRGFPEPIGQWRVSEGNNARDPVWAPDGSALYYVEPPNLMKVDVATEGTFSPGQPTVLFTWSYNNGGPNETGYDIHPDGDHFLVAQGFGGGGFGDVYIVTNWFEELRQRMGN